MSTPQMQLLEERLQKEPVAERKIDILAELGVEARNYDTDEAMRYANQIIQQSEKLKYKRGIGKGCNLKGSVLTLHGDYEEANECLQKAQEIADELNDQPLKARVQNNMGNIFRDQGDFANALTHYERAMKINERTGDNTLLAINLNNIANLWYELGDYDTAMEYALKCVPLLDVAHNQSRLINIFITLGNIYLKQEMLKEAQQYFNQVLELAEPQTANYLLAWSGVGKIYYKMQEYDKSIALLKQALHEANKMELAEIQIICTYYLGFNFMAEENYRKAKQFLEEAYDMAQTYSRRHDMISIHEALSTLYDRMGNVPKAFEHLKKYESLKDEVFQQTTFNKLRNLQIRQQTELANKEREVAERTATLKQQFMANMSHEIRTPMNAIVGMTRLLLSKEPKKEQVRYLNAIAQSADNLLVIINDILDLSKIEAGKIVIEKVPFRLRDLLGNTHDMLSLKAKEKQLQFVLQIDDQLPQALIGDPSRLNQVLVNLLGNSIKFTESGSVNLIVKLDHLDDKQVTILFEVKDTGIGISEDYVSKIFESFTQAGTDTARKYGGTGLGLTISKQLTELMHGAIWVESELGKGTSFFVSIPFLLDHSNASNQKKEKPLDTLGHHLKGIRILLVEDNEFNRMVAEDTLSDLVADLHLDIAENGKEAVELVQKNEYDLVLMDIQMPVMDGLEATKHIRQLQDRKKAQTAIVAMTANVLQEDVQRYLQAGMNAYVAKPFDPADLLEKMSRLFTSASVQRNNTNYLPKFPDKVTNVDFLSKLTGGKEDKMKKYIRMFLDNAPQLISKMETALERKDFESIRIAAHSLKPQLGYMGIPEELSHILILEKSAGNSGHFDKIPDLIKNVKLLCEKAFEELKQREKPIG